MNKPLLNNSIQFCVKFGKRFFVLFLLMATLCISNFGFANKNSSTNDINGENNSRIDISPKKLPFPKHQKTRSMDTTHTMDTTVVSYDNYKDPLIKINRGIFKFNDITYRYFFIPLSKGYIKVVPDPVEKCIGNFFYNIKTPIYAINHLLQRKPKLMGRSILRFGINTTIGILGLFDPAKKKFQMEKEATYFENTLGRYGINYGIYLVVPIFGPSDLRSGTGAIVDNFLNPITYLVEFPTSLLIQGFDNFQYFAPRAEEYNILRLKSDDPYIFFRNFYLQGVQRDANY